jgi:1-deoxy-D-xylulose-5-phosphate synthase
MGHAGTAISTALGIAAGDHSLEVDRSVVAFVGDAAMGSGCSFEGLNHAGVLNRNLLVILNDNRFSISRTVGALSAYLNRIRTNPLYKGAKKELRNLLSALPMVGKKMDESIDQMTRIVKSALVPGGFFEELGLGYYGPMDGHDLPGLIENLERIRRFEGLVIFHALTEKGRGAEGIEEEENRLHGVSPRAKPAPRTKPVVVMPGGAAGGEGKPWTKLFTQNLIELARRDERVCAITAAMPHGTGLNVFQSEFPERFYDTGIAEQHAVAFAAGLAAAGRRPVAAIYSTFLQRAYDQVFQEVLLQKLPVLLAMDRAGVVGEDGATHNGLFDIAFLRTLPGLVLAAPRDGVEMGLLMQWWLEHDAPLALRYPRGKAARLVTGLERPPVELGRAERVRAGERVALFAYGSMTARALEAARLLAARQIEVEVWNARFAKPLDRECLARLAAEKDLLVTLEEHALTGGFGSAVLEILAGVPKRRAQVLRLGLPDRFLEHAPRETVLHEAGLSPVRIAEAVTGRIGASRSFNSNQRHSRA